MKLIQKLDLAEGQYRLYESLDSTQEEALRLLLQDSHLPAVIVEVYRQDKGRGQFQRVWSESQDPWGQLKMTFAFRQKESSLFSALPLLCGHLVWEFCQKILPEYQKDRLFLKWPNDLYLEQTDGSHPKKVGGLLIEFKKGVTLVGLGLNLFSVPSEIPAASLKAHFLKNLSLRQEFVFSLIKKWKESFDLWRSYPDFAKEGLEKSLQNKSMKKFWGQRGWALLEETKTWVPARALELDQDFFLRVLADFPGASPQERRARRFCLEVLRGEEEIFS